MLEKTPTGPHLMGDVSPVFRRTLGYHCFGISFATPGMAPIPGRHSGPAKLPEVWIDDTLPHDCVTQPCWKQRGLKIQCSEMA